MNLIQKYYLPWHFPLRRNLPGSSLFCCSSFFFPRLVRQVDYTAAPIDPGAFSAVILAVSAMLIFKAVTWWLLKTIWPVFSDYSTHHFERNFKSLLALHKVIIYLVFYLALFYGFVMVLGAIV